MEGAIAIIMVALTGFRSLFRKDLYTQRKSKTSYTSEYPLQARSGWTRVSDKRSNVTAGSERTDSERVESAP